MIQIAEGPTKLRLTGDDGDIARISSKLRVRPKGFQHAPSYKAWELTDGHDGWDGYVSPIRMRDFGLGDCLRGHKDAIIEVAGKEGIKLNLEKCLRSPFAGLVSDDIPADLIAASFELDEYQRESVAFWLNHGMGVNKIAVNGGKCLGRGTLVMMIDGSCKAVEDLVVGDQLMGPDSQPRFVTGLGHGFGLLYQVHQRNGDDFICNSDHILVLESSGLRSSNGKNYSTGEQVEISVSDYCKLSKWTRNQLKGFKTGVSFRGRLYDLSPYFLGLWLGDGSSDSPAITTGDPEIKDYLGNFARNHRLKIRVEPGDGCATLHLTTGEKKPWNPITRRLRKLGVLNNKHIPRSYLTNHADVRRFLLAGLIDSDGHVLKNKIEFTFCNARLAQDVLRLCRSLGLRSTMTPKQCKCQTGAVSDGFRIIAKGDFSGIRPLVARKSKLPVPQRGLRYAISVTSQGWGEYFGFTLNGDGRFLLGDFTVSHNTAMFAAAAAMIQRRYPEDRILYVTQSERLVKQAYKDIRGFLPGWSISQYGGSRKDNTGKDMVIATVAMLWTNLAELMRAGWFRNFIALLYDECFTAGTLVDGVPIERVLPGHRVKSVNEAAWCIEYRPVVRVFKSRPSSLLKITFCDGSRVICTPGHPFYSTSGWTPAFALTTGSMVCIVNHDHGSLQKLRRNLRDYEAANLGQPSLLRRGVQVRVCAANQFGDHGPDESEIRVGPDEESQPDEESLDQAKGEQYVETDWARRSQSRREWRAVAGASAAAGCGAALADRSYGSDRLLARGWRLSDSLFLGHRQRGFEDRHRDRWAIPQSVSGAEARFETHGIFGVKRVDCVEVLKPTSDGRFGGLCPDGCVYNLEVEGNHNYVANGCLVHNCHHVASETSTKLLMRLPCYFRLGASDTKHDSDPAKMAKIQGLLGPIRYTVPVGTYIDIGRSAKPTIYLVQDDTWRNRFSSIPHLAEPGTPAWCLVGEAWKKGVYVGPVYQRDEDGKVVLRKVRELEGVDENEVFDGSGQVETVKNARWVEVEKPIIVDGVHAIRFEGGPQEYHVDSRYCLLRRTIDKAIITFKERNALIAQWVRYYAIEKQFPTLVVCTRTMHVLILETLLQGVVGDDMVRILFSDHTSAERDKAFEWFRETNGGVLISPLVKEGVSINEIRGGVIADHLAGWESANQIIGRFIRKKKGENEAHITFFIDVQHPALRRGSRAVFNRLYDIRGYKFVHPVLGPDTIGTGKVFERLD